MKWIAVVFLFVRFASAASSLTGTVQSASNAPIDGARVSLWALSNGKGVQTTTSDGRYAFSALERGQYLVAIECDGCGALFGIVRLARDDQHEIGFVIDTNARGLVKALPPHRQPSKTTHATSGKPKVEQARLLNKVSPVYPQSARSANISGAVLIEVELGTDGALNDLVVLSAPSGDLAVAALIAVEKWRYSPARLDGQPVPALFTIDVNFEL